MAAEALGLVEYLMQERGPGAVLHQTGAAPDLWLFVLGGLFILVTLALPHGIVGLAKRSVRPGGAPAMAAR